MFQQPAVLSWRKTDLPPSLSGSAIHLWRLNTGDTGADPAPRLQWLAPKEQARSQALHRPEVRARYLRTHIGLRMILASYLGRHPREVAIERSVTGKPYLTEPAAGLVFNLTTTGDLALIAIARGTPIGVDCELIRARPDLERIAERMFPAHLAAAIRAAPPEERVERFHLAWTALEADVKADGRGLFRERHAAAMPPSIAHCTPAAGYVAAVARIDLAPPETWVALEPSHTLAVP